MSRRRVFDIDFPAGAPVAPAAPETKSAVPAGTKAETPAERAQPAAKTADARRGPMATAITENADALRSRAAAEQQIRAENDRLAHEFVRLKKLGLVVDRIPLDKIRISKLTRDRSASRDPDLDELKESIRSIGLSNPVRVEEDGDGYQLVQGFRRLNAYQALYQETGDAAYAEIPAGLVARGETLQGLYRRMVDENLVRRDISFAEMAQLAMSYATDPEIECASVEEAVNMLFASAGRQKRVYIRNFAELLELIGGTLAHPEAIPRALGLELRKLLLAMPGAADRLQAHIAAIKPEGAEAEIRLLRQFADDSKTAQKDREAAAPKLSAGPKSAKAKTTLRCAVPAGTVRCQARDGKIEMAMERDFSTIDQRRLEGAIEAFFAALDED